MKLCLIFCLTILPASIAKCAGPLVKTTQGLLKGKEAVTNKGRLFNAFTGIPYGEPPVGKLRFKPPQPAKPWIGTFQATEPHNICPQIVLGDSEPKGTEDCLYLNVYTPKLCTRGSLLPVMIFIHGGGFMFGDANFDSNDPRNFMDKDIILVIPNYRLGPLGFLSTGDEIVPGNNGLKDQNLVIQWVKANILNFGGNPNRITIFGQSAGGTSAHYHMLSPLSKNLISGVIAESGTAISMWGLAPNDQGKRHFRKLTDYFNCSSASSQKVVECLRSVGAYELVRRQDLFYEWQNTPMTPFKPVIEPKIPGAFISKHPIDIIKSGEAAKVPFVIGITSEDGAMISPGMFNNSQVLTEFNNNFEKIAPITLGYYDTAPDPDLVSEKIRKFYFGDEDINNSSKPAVTNMFTDGVFLLPADEVIELHVKYTKQPVYNYVFGYRGNVSFSVIFGDSTYNYGACHADELIYLFSGKHQFPNYEPTEKDIKITDILTTLWVNFATNGIPTPVSSSETPKWQPVKSNLEYYVIKNDTTAEMRERLYWNRIKFWKNLPLH